MLASRMSFADADVVPIMSIWNPATNEVMFTTSASEYNGLAATGWQKIGIAYYGYGPGVFEGVQTVPMNRLYNPVTHVHHYSTDPLEVSVLVTNGWINDGVMVHVMPSVTSNQQPLHRIMRTTPSQWPITHYWTAYQELLDYGYEHGWVYDGIVGYVVVPECCLPSTEYLSAL
jgi:hypothetical protein